MTHYNFRYRKEKKTLPYSDRSTPAIGDKVKHRNGKSGTVTHIQLNYPSLAGRDAVSVKFDDGSSVAVSAADEFTLLSRAHR